MEQLRIFVVEDDPWFEEMLKHHVSLNPDYCPHVFKTGKERPDHLRLEVSKHLNIGKSTVCNLIRNNKIVSDKT